MPHERHRLRAVLFEADDVISRGQFIYSIYVSGCNNQVKKYFVNDLKVEKRLSIIHWVLWISVLAGKKIGKKPARTLRSDVMGFAAYHTVS